MFQYIPNFINETEQKEIFDYMENTCNFIPTHQYTNNISRYQKWYQSDKKYFCPEWKERYPQWESFEIDCMISKLIDMVQPLTSSRINSCLINKYPTGKHFISPHRDSIISFGEKPDIIILSLGETRQLLFENNMEKISFDLEPGSVFIMSGNSQTDYLHSLVKSNTEMVRYSLTFREFIL